MPKVANVPGLGTLRFPDETPDDVIDRTVKKEVLGLQFQEAQAEIDKADRFIGAVDTVAPVVGAVSLGRAGAVLRGVATDAMVPHEPGTAPATMAAIRGEPIPDEMQKNVEGSVFKSSVAGLAQSLPVVGATILTAGAGVPAVAAAAVPMAASAFEASGGDVGQTVKAGAIGAALPVLGAAGMKAGGAVAGALANRGGTALANPAVQQAIETGVGQVPIQSLLLGDLVSSDEYQNATPEERNRLLKVHWASQAAFGIPDIARGMNPNRVPEARRFESPSVDAARMLADAPMADPIGRMQELAVPALPMTTEVVSRLASKPTVKIPGGIVPATPLTADAMRQKMSGIQTESGRSDTMDQLRVDYGESQPIDTSVVGKRIDEGGGKVSFSAEAPTLLRNAPEQPTRKGGDKPLEEVQGQKEEGVLDPMQGVPYRRPGSVPIPTQREREIQQGRANVEAGLYAENPPMEPVAPEVGQYPESGGPFGTLSKGQRQKALAALERSQGLRRQDIPSQRVDSVKTQPPTYEMALIPGGKQAADALKEAIGFATAKGKAEEAANPSTKGEKMRKFSARVGSSKSVPEDVRKSVLKNPRSTYDPQVVQDEAVAASTKSPIELAGDVTNPDSNTSTLSGLELVKRAFTAGDTKGGEEMLLQLAAKGTQMGQLINQYKLLVSAVPQHITTITDMMLQAKGYDPMPPAEKERITGLSKTAIDAENNRKKADQAYIAAPSKETWDAVADASAKSEQATHDLDYAIARKAPKNFSDTIVAIGQGNLITPISQVANVVGNAGKLFYEVPVNAVASVLDAVESAVTGKPRSIVWTPVGGASARLMALKEAAGVSKEILLSGSDTAHIEAGQYGGTKLNAIRAWRDLFNIYRKQTDLPTKDGKVPLADSTKLFIEGTFGIPADVMLRGLGAMDAAFRFPERARLVYEAAIRSGRTPEEAMRATKRPELFLSKKDLKQVEFDASRSVYQQNNLATEAVAGFNNVLRKVPGLYVLSKIVVPFQKTPINVAAELISYTPAGLAKAVYAAAKGNRREANLSISKVIVGTMGIAAADWMFSKGVISPPLDAEDEAQKTRLGAEDVLPAGHINITGLKRAIAGEDGTPKPGDDVRDMRRLGMIGGIAYLTSYARRQVEKKRTGETRLGSEIATTAPAVLAQWTVNQSFLQGVSQFVKSFTSADGGEKWLQSMVETISAFPMPNTIPAISRAIRESKPEFRDDNAIQAIGNKLNERANALGFNVGFGKNTKDLPVKVDLWGRPVAQTPKGANPWVYNFFDITKSREIPDDAVAVTLYNLWRKTGDSAVFPSLPERILTIKGQQSEPLSYDLYQQLATRVGQARRQRVERLMDLPAFHALPDGKKIEYLKDEVYQKGRDIGMTQFLRDLQAQGITLERRKTRRGTE